MNSDIILKIFRSGWRFKIYTFLKLPSLLFWGVKIKSIEKNRAEILLPFSWRTQNPFRSIYFSALMGGAELSTGILGLLALEGKNVSMLVVGASGKFLKKADSKVKFICDDGEMIHDVVKEVLNSEEGKTITVTSKGYNDIGILIGEFEFIWSFKKRK